MAAKKINTLCILFLLIFMTTLLFSCKHKNQNNKGKIFVTVQIQKSLLENLVKEKYEIVSLIPPNVSEEAYDPSPSEISDLSQSKAYFSISGIGFSKILLEKIRSACPNTPIFDNSKGIHILSADPHIWNSTSNLKKISFNMYEALLKMDPPDSAYFKENLDKLENRIDKTDDSIRTLLGKSKKRTFIIYHPALGYFAKEYGLRQYSIETDGKEPSTKHIRELIDIVRKENLKIIFIQKGFDLTNAEIIAKETGCRLVVIETLPYFWDKELLRIAKEISNE